MLSKDNENKPDSSDVAQLGTDAFEVISNHIKTQTQVKNLILSCTKPHHWLLIGDNPYLNESGCKSVAALLGISISFPADSMTENLREDEKGTYYEYETWCQVSFNNRTVDEFGTANSRDPFFSRKNNKDIPQSEINLGLIKKKAITNAMNRAIKAMIGVDFDLETVQKVVGDIGDRKINYGKKNKSDTPEDLAFRNEIKQKIWAIADKDKQTAKNYLKDISRWKQQPEGIEDFDKLSTKQLKFLSKRINDDFAKKVGKL